MVKTAVILSGRNEIDSSTPYPLLPFDDNYCLIDRAINLLKELEYKLIYIIVGFRAEMFKKYESDSIKIVANQEYQFTGSMGALATIANLVEDDFLLIEGDTFYEKRVLESLTHTSWASCFAVSQETGSGDEAFVEMQEGFIVKVSKDKRQICNFSGELLGVLKISLSVFRRMLELWGRCKNPYVNYEYVFLDVTSPLERPTILFKDLIWGDVDNQKDFHKLKNYIYPKLKRRDNPFEESNIISHLEKIFSCSISRKDVVITPLGGMSNKNFQVVFNGSTYVLRMPGIGSDGMVDRVNEHYNNKLAEKLEITPGIRYFSSTTGIKLSDFICNAETLNHGTIQRADNLREIAEMLSELHRSNVRFINDFNVFREITHYENLLIRVDNSDWKEYSALKPSILQLQDELNDLGVELSPCHNDLVAENFIKSAGEKIYLIDWEYSGMNDPIWDLAALFLESNFTEESERYFYKHYFKDGIYDMKKVRHKIIIYQILMDVLWAIWTKIKEASGDDFGSYGRDRFKRAQENIKNLSISGYNE